MVINYMTRSIIFLGLLISVLSGCANVDTTSFTESNEAKRFDQPSEGKSGVYVYREDTIFGAAFKKDVYINGKCLGETAKGVFFYEEVEGDTEHKVSTETEFSPNDVVVYLKSGYNYFFEQYMKLGVFVAGAGIEKVDSEKGMMKVSELKLAESGHCGSNYPN